MKLTPVYTALLAAGLLAGCNESQTPATETTGVTAAQKQAAEMALSETANTYTTAFLTQQPALSTMLALTPEQAGGPYNDKFPDYTAKGMAALQKSMAEGSAALKDIDPAGLTPEAQTHRNILINIFDYYTGDTRFPAGYIDPWGGHLPYIINQISGPLIDMPKLMQVQQSVSNEQEADAYISRLEKMGEFADGVVAKFKADEAKGIVLPKKLHPKTIAFFNNFLASEPADHELVKTFAEKLTQAEGIDDKQREALVAKAIELVTTVVYPAWNRARDAVLESEEHASKSDGIWAQPGGDEFYAHEIRFLGDSVWTADEIHQTGLDEVDRISAQMDTILKENGYSEGTVGERMIALAGLPGQVFDATDEGRGALLDYLNDEIDAVMAKAPSFYGTIPEQAVEVRRIPPVSEAGEAGGFYSPPSLDGARPGIYWINLRDMEAVPKFGLKTLTYHEAVPGHHFQIALNMAQEDIGLMRQNAPYNAYVEGWALYSEYVAAEYMGMYDDDPLGDLGRLQAELYRAVRLVVDTGLHHKHWTREQAIDYFHKTTGTSLSDVVPEIERYMAWPGQALGYKLGMLTFVKLEKEARNALGDKYDIREFHDVVLLPGARPMAMVKSDVEKWVESKK